MTMLDSYLTASPSALSQLPCLATAETGHFLQDFTPSSCVCMWVVQIPSLLGVAIFGKLDLHWCMLRQ
jgi:hypothetical protein